MAVARDDLVRAARKRGIEGQVTIIRHFGIRCITAQSHWHTRNDFRSTAASLPG